MAPETAGDVEMSAVDLRYEECRVRNPRLERGLLADIHARGIERPLAGAEDDWRSFLKNPHLTAALLDRLTETSYVINMHNCRGIRGSLDAES